MTALPSVEVNVLYLTIMVTLPYVEPALNRDTPLPAKPMDFGRIKKCSFIPLFEV
jgi:hypothetical protein